MKNRLSGFTLVEILIVISIIAILASIMLWANVQSTYQKTRDSKRKQDLNKLVRSFEDYYNDRIQYPPANDPADGKIKDAPWGSALEDYVGQLPSDPLSPNADYYYQMGTDGKFFIIYAKLENTADPEIERLGCQDGCGPMGIDGKRAFNYYVSSSDVLIAQGIPNGEDPGALPGAPTATPYLTPTLNLNPPDSPEGICNNNQCCLNHWCGFGSTEEGGKYCAQDEKCFLNQDSIWVCSFEPACP